MVESFVKDLKHIEDYDPCLCGKSVVASPHLQCSLRWRLWNCIHLNSSHNVLSWDADIAYNFSGRIQLLTFGPETAIIFIPLPYRDDTL